MEKWFSGIIFILFWGISPATGQTLIWQEDFNDQDLVGQEWISSGELVIPWLWTNDPCAAKTFTQFPCFESTSAEAGYIYYDSEQNGPELHDAYFTFSQSIDCSAYDEVWLQLQSQYSHWSGATNARAFVGFSTDSLTYDYLELFQDIGPNQLPYAADLITLDISELAAGEPKVFIRFRWLGLQEYVWKIDEVALWDQNPRPENDLRILNTFFSRSPNGMTPVSQISPVRFLCDVINKGKSTQENVQIAVNVINTNSEELVYTDTFTLGDMAPEDTLENNLFPQEFLPPEKITAYETEFLVFSDATDAWMIDNRVSYPFRISANLFAKTNGDDFAFAGPQAGDVKEWNLGNCYYIPRGEGFVATKVSARIGAPAYLSGKKLRFTLYKWEDANGDNEASPQERGLGVPPDSSGLLVAETEYTIQGAGEEVVLLDLINVFDSDLPVFLEDDAYYLLMGEFKTNSDDDFLFYRISPVDYLATWFAHLDSDTPQFGAFYSAGNPYTGTFIQTADGLPHISLFIDKVSDVTEISSFPDEDHFRLFPNPARENLKLEVRLENTYSEIQAEILSLRGGLLRELSIPARTGTHALDVGELPRGFYFLRLRSGGFQSVLPFIIQ